MTTHADGQGAPLERSLSLAERPPVEVATVMRALNAISDPCSVTAGCPAGLVDMGLVRDVDIRLADGGAVVDVTLSITEPGCLMAAPFTVQATTALRSLPGVSDAQVRVDPSLPWDEDDLDPGYRDRLTRHRLDRRRSLGIEPVR